MSSLNGLLQDFFVPSTSPTPFIQEQSGWREDSNPCLGSEASHKELNSSPTTIFKQVIPPLVGSYSPPSGVLNHWDYLNLLQPPPYLQPTSYSEFDIEEKGFSSIPFSFQQTEFLQTFVPESPSSFRRILPQLDQPLTKAVIQKIEKKKKPLQSDSKLSDIAKRHIQQQKKELRKQNNRLSSQVSRDRKKQYIQSLESENKKLKEDIAALQATVINLELNKQLEEKNLAYELK